ncbi:MAG TPA: molybdate ABC transporter substrate-binding protein [Oscillatoriales cyanobacterium M4454_W2019_049]|nr:molybdate ABC transporter substrate-binding protein [Oscillatoriales cyanobacterium M4454_W2019_049]
MVSLSAKKYFYNIGLFLISLVLAIGCSQTDNLPSSSPPLATELTISAAASLKESLEAIQPLYVRENPEITLTYNFGSSGSLQQQIEQGAPVDIFFSAAAKQMDALEKKDLLLAGTRQDLLKNEMVLIVAKDNANVTEFQDLTNDAVGKIALGEPESVPAGKYAEEVLTSLNITDSVKAKAVYAKDVKQVLNYVATGNTEAGVVYKTDAQNSEAVKIVETAPENTHSPIVYPIAVLKSSKHPEAARSFVEFLEEETTQKVFSQYGFKEAN